MATSRKTILAIAGAALLSGACASGPHYGDQYSYGYGAGPAYYDPYYVGPTVGFRDREHRDREHRDRDRDERG